MCKTLHLALLNYRVHIGALFKPVEVPLDGITSSESTAPLSLVSSANVLRVHSITLCH